jgi:hypothetical protein
MTIGPKTYNAIPKFAFPRSYIHQLVVSDQSPNITLTDNVILTTIDITIGYWIVYVLDPRFMAWSSNRYTLDFPVVECYWQAFFDGVHHPQSVATNYIYYGPTPLPSLEVRNPFLVTDQHVFPLAAAPPGYWVPPYP